jgi:hypothetical protein
MSKASQRKGPELDAALRVTLDDQPAGLVPNSELKGTPFVFACAEADEPRRLGDQERSTYPEGDAAGPPVGRDHDLPSARGSFSSTPTTGDTIDPRELRSQDRFGRCRSPCAADVSGNVGFPMSGVTSSFDGAC